VRFSFWATLVRTFLSSFAQMLLFAPH